MPSGPGPALRRAETRPARAKPGVKLRAAPVCVMEAGESVVHPDEIHSLAHSFAPAELQETGIGPDSELFHILSSLIVRTIIFYFLYSVQFLLLKSLKYLCFQSHHAAAYEALADGVVGRPCINRGLNFIEFTEVLCWRVSKR